MPEPLVSDPGPFKESLISFDLRAGVSPAEAAKIADYLNSHLACDLYVNDNPVTAAADKIQCTACVCLLTFVRTLYVSLPLISRPECGRPSRTRD
jgi:hypothetical protein